MNQLERDGVLIQDSEQPYFEFSETDIQGMAHNFKRTVPLGMILIPKMIPRKQKRVKNVCTKLAENLVYAAKKLTTIDRLGRGLVSKCIDDAGTVLLAAKIHPR